MEDPIDALLQEKNTIIRRQNEPNHRLTLLITASVATVYGFWAMFVFPGLRTIPLKLKVFAAASLGFQSTGFEVNPALLTYARFRARWNRIPSHRVNFVSSNFWKVDLSQYDHVTVFLAPPVMEPLEVKLMTELSDHARVIVCRFPFPHWPPTCTEGKGLEQVWAYDVHTFRKKQMSQEIKQ
ncbi:ATP synthase subunit C lysine N-methyltransferase isoform X2 [Erpetoichthys calabaricus]|uniref:ATP synthase subunit C lysine N-methyltransferase isoform X2 n=1 Tax=Erpetoichthys calabaricus TaxID=27687 RepID=UPI00223489AD|nr:ATP synthase subunit C lysine N-methyltransferase isoform X2 [Erpetoichthys calabaricus]